MAGKTEKFNRIKENIKDKFNISESRKVKNFLGTYCERGCNVKGRYAKKIMDKDVNNLVEGYKNYTGSDLRYRKLLDIRHDSK